VGQGDCKTANRSGNEITSIEMYLPCGDFYQRQLPLKGGQMKEKGQRIFITPAVCLGLFLVLPWLLFSKAPEMALARPEAATICVAATTGNDTPGCGSAPSPCRTLQYAVDKAAANDEILVASGTYTGVKGHTLPVGYPEPPASGLITQVVYINKAVTIRGGYTTDFSNPPHPNTNPTTLDAQGKGRAMVIAGNIQTTLSGLRLTGGNAAKLGGSSLFLHGGGGLYVISATATISNNQVFKNSANDGGGIFLQKSVATLNGNTIYSNTIGYYGAGVLQNEGSATMTGNKLYFNRATGTYGSGGGLSVHVGNLVMNGNTIYSNTVRSNGGGIFMTTSKNALLTGNKVLSNTTESGSGGGVWMRYCDGMHMTGNTFAANTAYNDGGGLYVDQSYSTLVGNTIISNTAFEGGGMIMQGRELTLTMNTVVSNTAQQGGGLFLSYNDSALNRNTISFNRVILDHGGGGGVFIYYSEPRLDGNIISFNYADLGGGLGIFGSEPVIINTVVADNIADERGSGIFLWNDSSPRLWHSTIARNSGGDGSGVMVGYADFDENSVVMTNTIVVNQTVGISVTAASTVTLQGTLWYNNMKDWTGTGEIITGTHNYWGDPLFATDGYHIMDGSAAIDQGIAAGVANDVDNEPRLGTPDLGADELAVDYLYLYLPLIERSY
jgi:parallel beta-helix repeat protein